MSGSRESAAEVRSYANGYVKPGHPVMREVTAALQAACSFDLSRTAMGVDGCSIPTYAIPLRHLARAFARVATGQGLSPGHAQAAQRLRQAIAQAPQMVAGSGRFDTRVMQHFGAQVCCKGGAEAVHCVALPGLGLGIAIKMDDGNNARAADVVTAALIERLLKPDDVGTAVLRSLSDVPLRNWNGVEVGRLRAAGPLRAD
jgi:L-asparaginase II